MCRLRLVVRLALLLTAFSAPTPVRAQESPAGFRPLTGTGQSSYALRDAIVVDRAGFTWLAGVNRIMRHDGSRLRGFPLAPEDIDPRRDCFIFGLDVGPDGRVWCASRRGLLCLAPGDEHLRFVHGDREALEEGDGLPGRPILDLAVDPDGDAWFVSGPFLYRCRGSDGAIARVAWPDAAPFTTAERRAALAVDRAVDGSIWVVLADGLVVRTDPSRRRLRLETPLDFAGAPGPGTEFQAFHLRDQERALVGSSAGLFEIDFAARRWTEIRAGDPGLRFVGPARVRDVVVSRSGGYWLGLEDEGLVHLDPREDRLLRFRNDPGRLDSLPSDRVRVVAEDPGGSIWVGGERGYAVLESTDPFELVVPPAEQAEAALASRPAATIDALGRVWSLRAGGSLVIRDPRSGRSEHREETRRLFPRSDGEIQLAPDQAGRVWVAVRDVGVFLFDAEGRLDRRLGTTGDGLRSTAVTGLALEVTGNLVVAHDLGLDRYDPIADRVLPLQGLAPSPRDAVAPRRFARAGDGSLWAGSADAALLRIDPAATTVAVRPLRRLREDSPIPIGIGGLASGPDGGLWIAARNGVFRWDPETGVVEPEAALVTATAAGALDIVRDDRGACWIPTPWAGLVRFEPATGRVTVHRPEEVLGALETLAGSGGLAADGRVHFATDRGLLHFRPEEIRAPPPPLPPQVTSVKVTGEERLDPRRAGPIVVTGADRPVSIEFVSPSGRQSDGISYRYRLKSEETGWTSVGERRSIDFVSLPAGRHELEIEALAAASGLAARAPVLVIDVRLPLLERPLVRVALVLALLVLAILVIWLRLKRVDAQARRLRHEIDRREKSEAERRVLEEQLLHAMKLEAVGSLASGIAHDFNNILTAVIGHVSLLRAAITSGQDPARSLDDLASIEEAGQRAVGLTKRLLSFSRRDQGKPAPIDPGAVLDEMKPMLARLVSDAVELDVRRDAELGLVLADPVQLEQIVLNLVVNANDAMPEGGRLEIEMRSIELDEAERRRRRLPGDRALLVRVRDGGIGMDEATRQRIFEPYFTTKPIGEGSGLGLATVHGIVRQMQGLISVRSSPGEGSEFEILVPCVESGRRSDEKERGRGDRDEALVLVCEPNSELRALGCRLLELDGFRTVEAADVEEALAVARGLHEEPAVMLVADDDGWRGGDRLARIRRLFPGMRLLHLREEGREGELPAGEEILVKPFEGKSLVGRVRDLAGQRRGWR